jgi:hypothetical protein
MAFDIGKIISDFYSAASSPSAQLARRGMAAEKEVALNNEDYRKRRLQEMIDKAAADRQGLVNEGANSRQLLVNTGQLANTEAQNTGAMARQKLMEDTKRSADLNAFNRGIFDTQADIFKTQVLGNAKQPDNTLRGKEMEVAASILNNSTTDPNSPQAKWAMGILNSGQQPAQTANPETQPAKKQFVPSTSFDNNKDTAIPQQSKGAQSMMFDTNMGTAGKSPEQFRAETEDLYYRLNPQLKKKRDATLFGS